MVMGAAFLGGLLSSLMPCVYPMIPITIGVIGAKQASSRSAALYRGVLFALGLCLVYATLGVTAAMGGAMLGSALQHPYLLSAIAVFYIAMGLSMFGLFDLNLPPFINRQIARLDNQNGLMSVLLTGAITGVVAAPCVGPVVASLLLYVATTKVVMTGFALLFLYALGLAMPFVLLGIFSAQLYRLPKSGAWMQKIKAFFGLLLLVSGLYYLQPVLTPWLKHSKTVQGHVQSPAWVADLDQAALQARQQGKPMMIDFFAQWCLACKELDAHTYSDANVIELSQKFINVKVDMTRMDKKNDQIASRFQVMALPVIIFLDSNGRELPELRINGFVPPATLLHNMKKMAQSE